MDTQQAIAKVLQDFTAELLKVFSAAVVDAVSQVNSASRAISGGEAPVAAPRRGRPRKDATAAAPPKARKAPAKESRVLKSTPEQVSRLGERIVAALQKAARNLSAREILGTLKLSDEDEGRFQYALGKLKESGEVVQHGERREARYGVGSGKAKAKRGPGRPRKTPAVVEVTATPAPEAAEGI